ncbi:MAG TPA: DinB family protein [Terriglobales bacterium]|nr:DinB family protein [Terriglobales bacterium]
MTESARLADQIRRAFEGNAWHGDSVLKLLAGVDGKTAAARPIKNAHTIWELVLHISAWDDAVRRRAGGARVSLSEKQNFPPVVETSETAWRESIEKLKDTHNQLARAVARFPDSRLGKQVPGKRATYHTFFYMFSGIVQHELYHAGQIALLKKFR